MVTLQRAYIGLEVQTKQIFGHSVPSIEQLMCKIRYFFLIHTAIPSRYLDPENETPEMSEDEDLEGE